MVQPRHCIMTRANKSKSIRRKSNVSDRHSKVSEHKRRSSSPNLECDKPLALKSSPQMYKKNFYNLQQLTRIEHIIIQIFSTIIR